jgi:hypothetical protein
MTTVDITLQTGQLPNDKREFVVGEFVKLSVMNLLVIKNIIEAFGEEIIVDAERNLNG